MMETAPLKRPPISTRLYVPTYHISNVHPLRENLKSHLSLELSLYTKLLGIVFKKLHFGKLVLRSRVSSGSIVSDYGLDDRAIGVRSPARTKDFSSILCVQTGSGANPPSCTMGTGGPFPGGKSAAGA
jgi:hypothetical protein